MLEADPKVTEAKLRAAFAATPYPDNNNLVVDASGEDPECNEIAGAFQGKSWAGIPAQTIREFADALPLFTPAAFRYFLPAYMLASVQAYDEVDVAKSNVVFNLTPPARPDEYFLSRASLFNPMEREGIRSFLEFMRQRRIDDWATAGKEPPPSGIERAIEFWSSHG